MSAAGTAPAAAPRPDPRAVADLHARLRIDAALRDRFRPADSLAGLVGGVPDDDLVVAAALSALRMDCVVDRDAQGPIWTLRPAVRRKVLGDIGAEDLAGIDSMAARASPIADALAGSAGYQPAAIGRLIRAAEQGRPSSAAVLARVLARRLYALERAGPQAPAHDLVTGLRGALNLAVEMAQAQTLLAGGIFGREAEQAVILDWIADPQTRPPLRSLHVSGMPGIGKSYLLHSAVQKARAANPELLVVWLDFDRSGLTVSDATVFFEEISRQIGDALPATAAAGLRDIRLQAARARSVLSDQESSFALPTALIEAMGRAVAAQGRPVLIVLDTLEVVRARGETAVWRLFDLLDELPGRGFAPVAVLSAGRGDALDPVPERIGGRLDLGALPEAAAVAMLGALAVPDALHGDILAMAGGNPLLLRLGARAHEDGIDLAAGRAEAEAAGADGGAAGAYLYRAILSRLDPPLGRLAQAGMVLYRIEARDLDEILAPALDLVLDPGAADMLFAELAAQHWLVEADYAGGAPHRLRHHDKMRVAFLPLLYREAPALAQRVNAQAARVLSATGRDPAAALYHRLQLTRAGKAMPVIAPILAAQFDEVMIADLPMPARNALRRARGERSEQFRRPAAADAPPVRDPGESDELMEAASPPGDEVAPAEAARAGDAAGAREGAGQGGFILRRDSGRLAWRGRAVARPLDPQLIADLWLMLSDGDRREATYLVETALRAPFAPHDAGAAVVVAYLWMSGAWASAQRLWQQMGRPFDHADPELARILREIDAEARFFTARARLPELHPPPASGRSALLGGAYDVAVAMRAPAAGGDGVNRAATMLAPWLPRRGTEAGSRLAAEAAMRRDRAGIRLASDLPRALRHGVEMAALDPHVVPFTALASLPSGAARAAWLTRLAGDLPAILRLQVPWIKGLPGRLSDPGPTPFDIIDLLAICGLLADAATAMALALRDHELASLAAAAERWRRLSHGQWSLTARAPRDWRGDIDADPLRAELARRLDADPGAAEALLRLWLPDAAARDRLAGGRDIRHLPDGLAAIATILTETRATTA